MTVHTVLIKRLSVLMTLETPNTEVEDMNLLGFSLILPILSLSSPSSSFLQFSSDKRFSMLCNYTELRQIYKITKCYHFKGITVSSDY